MTLDAATFQSQMLAIMRDAEERYRVLAARLEEQGSGAAAAALLELARLKLGAAQALPSDAPAGSIPERCRWHQREWRDLLAKSNEWVPFRVLIAVLKHEWLAQQFVAQGAHGGEVIAGGPAGVTWHTMTAAHVALVENALEQAERTKA